VRTIHVSNGNPVLPLGDPAFRRYGRRLDRDFSLLVDWVDAKTTIPAEGSAYSASVEEMEGIAEYRTWLARFYGLLPYEIGYCVGRNTTLNGLEYHKGSEINVAATDLVLLLACLDQVEDNTLDVADVRAFHLERGDAVELYATCLHFAPCRVADEGFKAVVILPRGTNEPLPADRPAPLSGEDKLLFAVNKWLLAHPGRKPLMERGAFPGIRGENIEVRYA
jgi:hypothetical protein